MILQKSFLKICSYIYCIMNTIKYKKPTVHFSFASKIDLVWPYLSQNMGLFQQRKVQIQTKKREKVL